MCTASWCLALPLLLQSVVGTYMLWLKMEHTTPLYVILLLYTLIAMDRTTRACNGDTRSATEPIVFVVLSAIAQTLLLAACCRHIVGAHRVAGTRRPGVQSERGSL